MTRKIGMEVLIEEVEAMVNAEAIAASTPRLEALIFGPGDYSASQGVRSSAVGGVSKDYPGDVWPFADFSDSEGYRRECIPRGCAQTHREMVYPPNQIPIANEVFSPTAQQV